jgi:diguanylate cyclase (GGDEF)-like protein
MFRLPRTGLKKKLLVLVLVALIPAVGVAIYNAYSEFRQIKQEAQDNAERLVRLLSSNQNQVFDNAFHLLDAVSRLPAVRSKDPANCGVFLTELLGGFHGYLTFGVADTRGRVICSAVPAEVGTRMDKLALFQQIIRTHQQAVGPYEIEPVTRIPRVQVGIPLLDLLGNVEGVLYAQIDLTQFSTFPAFLDLKTGTVLTVHDDRGLVFARYPNPEGWIGKADPQDGAVRGTLSGAPEGVMEDSDADGVRRLYAYTVMRRLPQQKVILSVGIPTESAYAAAKRILEGELGSIGVALLLIFGISRWMIDRFVLRGLEALLDATHRIRQGDMRARSSLPHTEDEVGQLAHAIDDMGEALEKRECERDLASQHLQESLAFMERHTTITQRLIEMSDLLQVSQTQGEALEIIARCMADLLQVRTGAIFTLNAAREVVASAVFGEMPAADRQFALEDCWALRRGKLHRCGAGEEGARCRHVSEVQLASLCVPVMAQGEMIGILHVRDSAGQEAVARDQAQLLEMIAERAGLALANLRLREELQDQATRDPLTGLYNRRHMQEMLSREERRARRQDKPLGIIMLDVDHFKQINDRYGHEAGDRVLQAIAEELRQQVRSWDIACRYGGEEFTIVMPETGLAACSLRAEELRRAVERLDLRCDGTPLGPLSISLGVASLPEHGATWQEVLATADQALYAAKAAGRNRVETAAVA